MNFPVCLLNCIPVVKFNMFLCPGISHKLEVGCKELIRFGSLARLLHRRCALFQEARKVWLSLFMCLAIIDGQSLNSLSFRKHKMATFQFFHPCSFTCGSTTVRRNFAQTDNHLLISPRIPYSHLLLENVKISYSQV